MNKKIGIIGHFGGGHTFLDGQTIKTKVFYEELKKRGFDDILCVDTYYNKTNKLRLIWDTFKSFFKCHTLVVLLSTPGLRVFLPMLYIAKKIFKIRIFHNVIGGNLAENLKSKPKQIKYLNAIDGNWVEFTKMAKDLAELGVTNCEVVPNFKELDSKKAFQTVSENGENKFCMFSRVMAEKGMTDAIEAVARYNSTHDEKIRLEIWGPVDERYKEEFEILCREHSGYVEYMGCADFNKSVEAITDNLALLFPTYWSGEGFPGTVIDAYAAAVPVIASDWNANSEIIRNFETGWVYPNDKVKTLDESIEWAMAHKQEMAAMRKNCLLLSTRYTPDFVMRRLVDKYFKY